MRRSSIPACGDPECTSCSRNPLPPPPVGQRARSVRQLDLDDKYEALALRSSTRMEMRIFRSTLVWESFCRNVEFTAASVDFCRDASPALLTEDAFKNWLSTRRRFYPNLTAFIHGEVKRKRVDAKIVVTTAKNEEVVCAS